MMGAVNRVHGDESLRSWRRRMGVSTVLALAVGACWLAAIGAVVVPPLLYGELEGRRSAAAGFLARWTAAGLLLLLAVAILLHFAPERRRRCTGSRSARWRSWAAGW